MAAETLAEPPATAVPGPRPYSGGKLGSCSEDPGGPGVLSAPPAWLLLALPPFPPKEEVGSGPAIAGAVPGMPGASRPPAGETGARRALPGILHHILPATEMWMFHTQPLGDLPPHRGRRKEITPMEQRGSCDSKSASLTLGGG